MKQSRKMRAVSCTVAAVLTVGTASMLLSACTKEQRDNETTPLTLASDLFDGVFNPFFYTSGPDGEVVGMTQIGMLAGDENGDLVAGDDQASVAKAYSVVTEGTSADKGPDGSANEYANYYTDYYFAIKDDLTFSDGTPVTINDVLFNIYMYLDPAYTGSSTMYSVDIQGLSEYRTQQTSTGAADNFENEMDARAQARIKVIQDWAQNNRENDYASLASNTQAVSDIDKLEELFLEELNTDWTTAMNADMDEYEKYGFTENWQVFMYNYNQYTIEPIRDPATHKVTGYKVTADFDTGMAKDQATLVNYVYSIMLGGRESASKSYKTNLVNVMLYYASASSFRSYLVADETRKELTNEAGEVELRVRTVSGITTMRGTSIPSEDGDIELGEELDILHIRINGEDPKAIQNFSFTVAPLHYYSPIADQFTLEEGKENFGVSWSDPDFMNEIRVIQVPLGAGPYRASVLGGCDASTIPDKGDFYSNNMVYLERNDSFLLGAPKIKYVRYQVISQSLLYDSIKSGTVNYGSPTATNEMIGRLENEDRNTLDYTITDNLGYGYIGINAAYVKDREIRQAIMYALDPTLALAYYGGGTLASILYRPMSSTIEWCYPKDATAYYPFDATGQTSLQLAQKAGYEPNSEGLLEKNGETLSFTFTIAGDTSDHPAYATMERAADILNGIGFDISVTTDSTALSKLSSGLLEVWAAAWSSSSDPDMYQVYHKDSTATSILNWGFPTIEREGTTLEKDLLDELAIRIEEGRETTDRTERANIYGGMTGVSLAEGGSMEQLSALDLVMELAVEFPLYQRKALFVYQEGMFDEETLDLFAESTAFQSPISKIWLVSYAQ